MRDPKLIDLSKQQSEAEWQATLDSFFLAATPKVFEWMRWVIALAALGYVQRKTGSAGLAVLLVAGHALVLFYFNAYFMRFEFRGLSVRRPRAARIASLSLSGLLGFLTYIVVRASVDAVLMAQP